MNGSIGQAFAANLQRYDFIFIIGLAVNIAVFVVAVCQTKKLYDYFVLPKASKVDKKRPDTEKEELSEGRIRNLRNFSVLWYNIFINVSAAFPLLGILGTVWSLLGMVGSEQSFDQGFYAALTSTVWGIILALVFKVFFEPFLTSLLDSAEREADHYLEMLEYDKDKKTEAEDEEA